MKSEKEIREMLEKQRQRDSKKEQITNEKMIRQSTLNAFKGKENVIILDPKGDIVEEILKNSGRKIRKLDLSKSKCGWFNPITGESSHIEELKEKAKKAIESKNYRKAYRLLSRVKRWQKQFK